MSKTPVAPSPLLGLRRYVATLATLWTLALAASLTGYVHGARAPSGWSGRVTPILAGGVVVCGVLYVAGLACLLAGARHLRRRLGEGASADPAQPLARVHASLRAAETKYRTLFESSNEGVLLMTDVFLDCNEQACELWACAREDIVGHAPWEFSPERQPDGRLSAEAAQEHITAAQSGTTQRFDWQHRRKDGVLLDTEVLLKVIEIGGRPLLLATVRDITARKRADEALRESEERFRTITAAAQDAIIMLDEEGRVSYWNPAAEVIFGYAPGEVLGHDVHTLLAPPSYRAAQQAAFHHFQASGQGAAIGRTLELTARRKGGAEFPIELSVSAVKIRGRWHAIGILRDVTERTRLREAEREHLHFLQSLLDAIPAAIFYKDLAGRYLGCNDTCAAWFGRSRAALIGHTVDELMPPEFAARQAAHDAQLLQAAPGRQICEDVLPGSDGTTRAVLLHKATYTDAAGRVAGLVGAAIDITERKHAEQRLQAHAQALQLANLELEAQKQRLETHQAELRAINNELQATRDAAQAANRNLELSNRQLADATRQANELARAADVANAAKSAFLANMSHEIRTPLTAIAGFAELLVDEALGCARCPDHEHCTPRCRSREYAGSIRRNSQHLIEVVNDILDLSKIESGRLQIESVPCALAPLLSEVESLMRVRAAEKGLRLTIACAGSIPALIRTDPTRLRQVLINLIGNAVKFTAAGSVRVVARLVDLPDGSRLQFDVIDTGIGIAPEHLPRLFQPFSQADTSMTRRFGGTGLGLAISQRLAEQLGGGITVVSTPGQGSTFTVTVRTSPLVGVRLVTDFAQRAPDDERPARSRPAVHLAGRILLAEDGPDNQRLLTHLLELAGAEVTLAQNGQEALEQACAAQAAGRAFDIVLMDMQMPVMDGYDATRRLRAAGYTRPIIALTAHAMTSDRDQCLAAGCDEFISKPVERATLLATLGRHLQAPLVQDGPPPEPAAPAPGALDNPSGEVRG